MKEHGQLFILLRWLFKAPSRPMFIPLHPELFTRWEPLTEAEKDGAVIRGASPETASQRARRIRGIP